jgi:hypothetical protein
MLKLATKFVPNRISFVNAQNAGFRFAEFWLDVGCLTDWRKIAQMASEFALKYTPHFPNHGDLNDQELQNAVSLYQTLGCSAMVIHQPMFDRYHQRLLDLDATLRLAIENHRLTPVELHRWASESEWLTLDVEHLWMLTYGDARLEVFLDHLREFLSRFADKVLHVHLPGYLPGYAEHRPMYCARELVLPVLSSFAAHRFDGFIVSEVETEFQNPYELRMDVLLFERWRELYLDGESNASQQG